MTGVVKRMPAVATVVVSVLVACTNATAQYSAESAALATRVPIADVHFHLEGHFVPADIKALLDRNNVRWAGGVGPFGRVASNFRQGFIDAMGERYIATLGQPEFSVLYFSRGASATEDSDTQDFRALLQRAEAEFKAGRLKGFGELFVNNRTSNSQPAFRRKIATDAPTIRAMYQLAAKYGGFVAMHMEVDPDSLQQLDALASMEPRATVILSHCGVWADAGTIRALLDRHPNIHCDLAWRSPPTARQVPARIIFDATGVKGEWLDLIEQKADRFMIGTDAFCCDYGEAIDGFRKGLLQWLSPATLRKVAYENAKRVMKLSE